MIEFLKIALFCVTFYFTVIRMISWIKIFNFHLTSLYELLGFESNNTIFSLIGLSMWCYQIYFWFNKIGIL